MAIPLANFSHQPGAKAVRRAGERPADVSHELYSPLHNIIGLSRLLIAETAGPLSDRHRRLVTHIQHEALRLLELVNDPGLGLAQQPSFQRRIHTLSS